MVPEPAGCTVSVVGVVPALWLSLLPQAAVSAKVATAMAASPARRRVIMMSPLPDGGCVACRDETELPVRWPVWWRAGPGGVPSPGEYALRGAGRSTAAKNFPRAQKPRPARQLPPCTRSASAGQRRTASCARRRIRAGSAMLAFSG
ncbi:hypothetical protein Stsp01_09950 [Streptomyces sp. NBRC 13847]|nr:hypothetical protein Stsp01_09950 [Streptomyces sp. NBRC 13847]